MDRRQFLLASSGLAGVLPLVAKGQTAPCPPPTLSVSGGSSSTTQCAAPSGDAESDWLARSTGAGVIWAHDFRSDAEVTKYRLDKFDFATSRHIVQTDAAGVPLVRRITSDGITGGGCLELFTPVGGHNNSFWCRPFVAVPGDRGYVSGPDVPSPWNLNWTTYRRGLYGHRDYHVDDPARGIQWAGEDFYIQFRYKVAAASFSPQQAANMGKLAFIDLAGGGNQEIVIQSPIYGSQRFWMYTNYGSKTNANLNEFQGMQGTAGSHQPGGAFNATCMYPNWGGCWQWPMDEWVTVLIHVIPGHHNGDSNQPDMTSPTNRKDTGIEVWVARRGETSYTKIWDKRDYVWSFDSSSGIACYGFNVFMPSQYMNNVASTVNWYRRFDQVIFSRQAIPCPLA